MSRRELLLPSEPPYPTDSPRSRSAGQLAREARAKAAAAARFLRETYGVSRVLLFGSLARGNFREDGYSDIDLCVGDLPPHLYYRVYADLERILAPFKVDLLVLTYLDAEQDKLKQTILSEGVDLL